MTVVFLPMKGKKDSMSEHSYTEEELLRSRSAEKGHLKDMPMVDHLLTKPFLRGVHQDVDRALFEIGIFAAMVQCLPCGPGAVVLDLGAGSCWISEWLQKLNFTTVSTDINHDMLALGKQRLAEGSNLCTADMAKLPFRDESIDAAICYAALHHVPNWPQALREIQRVLKPGGVLVLQEPGDGHSESEESQSQMDQFGVLEQELPARKLRKACLAAGFKRAYRFPVLCPGFARQRLFGPYRFFKIAPRMFLHKNRLYLGVLWREKILNLFVPYHLVVAAKGDLHADSRRPEALLARFREEEMPIEGKAGQSMPCSITVHNTGRTTWLARTNAAANGQVRLGVMLQQANGALVDMDYLRIALPSDVRPGELVTIEGAIPLPENPGSYQLKFDLVAEGICWFASHGTVPLVRSVSVHE
jgi:SAM-dependent methyltransferase